MKAIILKTQVKKKGEWAPVATRIFDVNDNVNVSTLAELFEPVCKPNCRVLVEERPMRNVPGAPVGIDEFSRRWGAWNARIANLLNSIRGNPRATVEVLRTGLNDAENEFREWCESAGVKFDWSKRD